MILEIILGLLAIVFGYTTWNTMKKVDSTMNTSIPGMRGYVPHKNRDKKKELEQFSWIYKG